MNLSIKLSLSNNIALLPIVRSFVAESASVAGFDNRNDVSKFELIAEEAFVYLLRTSFEESETGDIEIVAQIKNTDFFVSLFDKGLPFGKNPENKDELSQIQLNLLKVYCDKLEWINHGKNGKEMRIKFTRPTIKDITQFKLPKPKKQKPSEDIEITLLKPKDAYQVSQIIYKTYGYTYPNEDMYYPEIIENLNKEGKLISVVAVDKKINEIVGHYAIERYQSANIVELGQAVIVPEYRGKGLLIKMRNRLEEMAKNLNIKGVFSQPVTSHTKTQKVNENFGSRACGISFGLVPSEFNYKKMEIKPLNERETCFFYYKPIIFEKRNICIPKKHGEIIRQIYDNLGLKIENRCVACSKSDTQFNVKYNTSWGFGTINVLNAGINFKDRLYSAFNQLKFSTNAEVIFLNIPLVCENLDMCIEEAEKLGFFFCGVIPYAVNDMDVVRFQYLNTLIDTSRIKVYGAFANCIFDYSVNMMRKALKG